jgi:DNA helicase-2/ATP-dependent DNA helicase PcrA
VYHNLILPYEPSIANHFSVSCFTSRGICLTDPPPQRIKNKNGEMVYNPLYKKKNEFIHYITKNHQYYCTTLSELALQVKEGRETLVKRAAARLNLFYDSVLIDEFQDFREYDYELIVKLAKHLDNVLLVGDYYQHSVSAKNNTGKPFKTAKGDVPYYAFVDEVVKAGFEVDTTTLSRSRRCSIDVCNYVSRKLGINISSTGSHEGAVIWINENIHEILRNDKITKLVYSDAIKYSFQALNWSYSKGDTMDCACVILTKDFEHLSNDNFTTEKISVSTLNKLYVAMTRSRGNLYLIKSSTFKEIQDLYRI